MILVLANSVYLILQFIFYFLLTNIFKKNCYNCFKKNVNYIKFFISLHTKKNILRKYIYIMINYIHRLLLYKTN